jgi:hypothetical protein
LRSWSNNQRRNRKKSEATMRLEIGRMTLDCLVDANHSNPRIARDRVQALSRRLPTAMAPWLDGLAGGEEIILIRSLNLDVTIDVENTDAVNLARWSRAFASALARGLASHGHGVVRFANRAEQLAQFLRDVARGDAWSLWFHRHFEGLRGLPTPQALATALADDPLLALDALALLDDAAMLRTGDLLGSWVERLVAAFPATAAAVPFDDSTIDSVCEAALRYPPSSRTARLLATLVAFKATTGAAPGANELPLCTSIVDILEMEEARRDAAREIMPAPGRSASVGGAREAVRSDEVRAQLLSRAHTDRVRARAHAPDVWRVATTIGGPLLLLRDVDRLDLSALASIPPLDTLSAERAFRALVLARLAGPSNGAQFLRDPFWRNLLDLPANVDPNALYRWANTALRGRRKARTQTRRQASEWPCGFALERPAEWRVTLAAGETLERFARRLPGFAQSSSLHLWRNFLDVRATAVISGGDRLDAVIARPPLDPILAVSGAGAWTETFGWTRPSRISVSREHP